MATFTNRSETGEEETKTASEESSHVPFARETNTVTFKRANLPLIGYSAKIVTPDRAKVLVEDAKKTSDPEVSR